MDDHSNEPLVIHPESPGRTVTVVYMPRTFPLHTVSSSELDSLASGAQSVHLTFLGLSLGISVTVGITLLTVDIASAKIYASFVGTLVVSVLSDLYCGVRALLDVRDARRRLDEIKSG